MRTIFGLAVELVMVIIWYVRHLFTAGPPEKWSEGKKADIVLEKTYIKLKELNEDLKIGCLT
jgi:hypothetical protein